MILKVPKVWNIKHLQLIFKIIAADLSEIAANLQSDLDRKQQVKNYGYPIGGQYYKVIKYDQYDTQ